MEGGGGGGGGMEVDAEQDMGPPLPQQSPNSGPSSGYNSSQTGSSDTGADNTIPPINPFMSLIIVLLVLLFGSFTLCMAFIAMYLRRSVSIDIDLRRQRQGLPPSSTSSNNGLHPSIISSFPIVAYPDIKSDTIGTTCPVCLSDFEGGSSHGGGSMSQHLKQLPRCKHAFHADCIDKWLETHTTCPMCRINLVGSMERWPMSLLLGSGRRSSRSADDSSPYIAGSGRRRSRSDSSRGTSSIEASTLSLPLSRNTSGSAMGASSLSRNPSVSVPQISTSASLGPFTPSPLGHF